MDAVLTGRRFPPRSLALIALLFGFLAGALLPRPALAAEPVTIEAFVREGCPHCAKAEEFLMQLQKEQPGLRVTIRDVQKERAAMERLKQLAREHRVGAARVPAIFVGDQLIIGYSEEASTDKLIRSALAGETAKAAHAGAGTCEAEESLSCPQGPGATAAPPESFEISFLGRTLTLDDIGLPAFTLAMGLLDGFNPCSMWVLLLMISLLAPLNDRKRMVAIAGTFVLVEGIAYFLFMAAWLNFFMLIGVSRAVTLVVAAIAIVAGLINLKDFVSFGRGISLSIPERAKPGIYNRMRGLLHAPTMTAAIIGAAVLAVLIQIVEFMCTSGFPALFTRILTLKELDTATYYGFLLLYIAAYMLDDIIILTIGVVMLSRHRLQEREGRVLKLVSGVVMVGLGVYLIFLT
ncbi:MAG TPA: glutaredoxin family protein [Burkholderiaceae bacterium]|nr:glutaredoxin family protein [Burkholderiaceae bacterium]HQR69608.1 glutaredoxin family protein [Burkholderiaceae bacterium]